MHSPPMKSLTTIRHAMLVAAGLGLAASADAQSLPPAAQRLYDQARSQRLFADAERLAPTTLPTSDGRSFTVAWRPPGGTDRWVVSLHGSGGYAMVDLAIWHRFLASRGVGYLGLQWWHGRGDAPESYDPPEAIYRELDLAARAIGIARGGALLHGFSRGSANLYAVAALDATRGQRLFSMAVANAGSAALDYPPTRGVTEGRFGPRPLSGTRWVTVCGERDPHPDRDGCPAMRRTGRWLAEQGAEILAAIEDPQGDHGVFHTHPRHVERVLDLFQGRR